MDKKQFDEMYVGNKVAVYCPTQELVDEFLYLANRFGYNWNTKETTSEQKNLAYVYNETFNSFDRMIADRYDKFVGGAIFKEFKSTKNDDTKDLRELLQAGRVVETREGCFGFVLKDKIIYKNGWDILSFFDANLRCKEYENSDIIRIYDSPIVNGLSWSFKTSGTEFLELVWERKEFEVSEYEKSILKNIPKKYKYITRDIDRELFVYEEEPRKGDYGFVWSSDAGFASFEIYNDCFSYITAKDEKPTLIADLLNS